MAAIDPNQRLQDFLSGGTEALRQHLGVNVVAGNERELSRLEQYHLYWKFYEGHHYRDFNHAMITLNYVKAFVDKVNIFLLGSEGPAFTVSSYYNDIVPDEIKRPIEELTLYQWRRNNKAVTMHEMLQMGSICGDVWVMPTWLPAKKYVKINILDSRQCFPIFKGGDYNEMISFQVRQVLDHNENGYKLRVTQYTNDKVETWFQKSVAIVTPEYNIYTGKHTNDVNEYEEQENPLGFIPIVHIKNRPSSNAYFGKSDCCDIVKLNKVYNELHQELKGIIDYYSTPTTVVTGATLKNMKRGLGNIWSGLPPEANVFTLGLDADLSAMTTFLDRLKTAMHEISDVPENVLGKIQSISGTSAAALQLTYQPLVQQADMKSLTYGEGIAEINDMMFKILVKYDKKNERLRNFEFDDTRGDIRIEPVFKYGFPTDRMNTLQELQIESQMNLVSRTMALERLGANNAADLIEQIDSERIASAEIDSQVYELQTPPMPNPNLQGDPNNLDPTNAQ